MKNKKLSIRNDTLREEISYLRGMVKYLINHIGTKANLDEFCTIEKMRNDLAYFEEKNHDIEKEHVYGPKDHINHEQRMW